MNDSSSEKKKETKPSIPSVKQFSNVPLELQEVTLEMTKAFNTLNEALKSSKRQNITSSKDEDDCDLYGRLLAKRLRQFSKADRQEIMYELDGLILSRCNENDEIGNNSDLSDS